MSAPLKDEYDARPRSDWLTPCICLIVPLLVAFGAWRLSQPLSPSNEGLPRAVEAAVHSFEGSRESSAPVTPATYAVPAFTPR